MGLYIVQENCRGKQAIQRPCLGQEKAGALHAELVIM